jgi:GH15 family glucan-1,4-alpha-glucosidase
MTISDMEQRYPPIESFGVIGDLRTIALVGTDATIGFMCFPEFDSPTIFASLLDHDRGGHWSITPQIEGGRRKQLYLPDTNILMSRTLANEGVTEILDFMPVEEKGPAGRLVRMVKTIRGAITFRMVCAPRFDYARALPRITHDEHGVIFEGSAPHVMRLRLSGNVTSRIENDSAIAEFTLHAGEMATFVLEEATDKVPLSNAEVLAELHETASYWRRWVQKSNYRGRWREIVDRSALVLKLMSSHKEGAIVAAPTFGLPEAVGGERNWDYRYTWIRDSSFTVFALTRLGYTDEAMAFMEWLQRRAYQNRPDGSLEIMYPLDPELDLAERNLDHLEGYRGSSPVRIGNDAQKQLQLDIYGEMMDAIYLANKYGKQISWDGWANIVRTIGFVEAHWQDPDEGVWEVRSGRKHFLHSRLMCWVAVDRALRVAQNLSLPAPYLAWTELRTRIHYSIHEDFWDSELQSFVQHKGSKNVDAISLLLPITRFISPTDPRWLSTLERIGHELTDDALVYRYRSGEGFDGLRGGEGSFTPCSFWYVECLARAGQVKKARLLFEKMLGYANHLGLYSEELGCSGEHLGNFPQAWTHLSLITAALTLDRAISDREKPAWLGWS